MESPIRYPDAPVAPELAELAASFGVATDYHAATGELRFVAEATVVSVLRALQVDVTTADGSLDHAKISAVLADRALASWRRVIPPVYVTREDRRGDGERDMWVHLPRGAAFEAVVVREDGSSTGALAHLGGEASQVVDGVEIHEQWVRLSGDLPLGWHRVEVRDDSGAVLAASPLVCVPAAVPVPAAVRNHDGSMRRSWGPMTQVYAMRSEDSWAQGDLADLGLLCDWAGRNRADWVLVNPLHAGSPVKPLAPSPYLPVTRRFPSPFYLRVESVPGWESVPAGTKAALQPTIDSLRAKNSSAELLDRDEVWAAKDAALTAAHAAFVESGDASAFTAFRAEEGQGLEDFALWCAMVEERVAQGWTSDKAVNPQASDYPIDLPPVGSADAEAARERLSSRIGYHCWLQWCIDEQLRAAQRRAANAGMGIGIVHDLAVGVHPDGADAWALAGVLAQNIEVGAPPDAFNQMGQTWSQPPWRPDALADAGFLPFRDMLRTILRHAGGVRIDHILGLFRLWWIPSGQPPYAGTYVRFDHEAMLGILALEAQRAGAVVIGEDLGTLEPWVQGVLRERGLLGTNIAWFETDGITPRQPETWRDFVLGSVTVHDLPPTRGYIRGEAVRIRAELGLLTRPREAEQADFDAGWAAWQQMLRDRGFLHAADWGRPTETEWVEAMHRFLAATPSRMLGVALVDLVGDVRAQNQPGTDQEYPNWRVPLCDEDGRAFLLEELEGSARAASLISTVWA
ncbi:MAG: 4-alpha-glucanotransferase [Actinomycetales bacterium]|nr:4-alpha-glucanotransferase [Actinomycetales bacterium]